MHSGGNETYSKLKAEDQINRFHTRQALSILVVFTVLAATFVIMLIKQYDLVQKHEKEMLRNQFKERVSHLENLIARITDHVDGIRVAAEADFLKTSVEPILNQPLEFSSLADVNGENRYHLDTPKPPITREMIGNLTGEGDIKGRSRDFYREIHMALTLNPNFRMVVNSIKNAAWVYYTSKNNFINIFPWVSSKDFKFSPELQAHEFYTLGLPQNNPDRKMFWTKVYVDEYGKGLMTTCAEPLYDGNRFVGTVAVDLTVDFLNTVVKKFNPMQGQMFLVNNRGQLVAHPTLITSGDRRTKPVADALPEALQAAGIQLDSLPADEFVTIGPYTILSNRMKHAPWQAIYLYPVALPWDSLTSVFGLGPLIVLALSLLMVAAVLFFTKKQFLSPSEKFVTYIMARSQGASKSIDFGVPRVWKPWFAAVEKIFTENEELARELKKQNENLENRVKERTTELEKEIEDRKQTERALRSSEERNRTILKTATDGFFIVNSNGDLLEVNDAYCQMIGYTQQELLGMSVIDLDVSEAPNDAAGRIKYILRQGSSRFESLQRRKDGNVINIEASVTSLHNGTGQMVCFLRDITERKRTDEELALNMQRIQALLQLNQMTEATLSEITEFALEEAVRLTGSTIGYLAFLNDGETVLTINQWSKTAMKECEITEKIYQYSVVSTGLWGEAVRQRRAVITNDYLANNSCKKGIPSGHIPLLRHMNTPVFNGDKIVAVAGVGNKETEYGETDVQQISLIMQGMWRLIERKRAEEEREEFLAKLAQVNKMEAIGTLAGGISHDFNNLLQAISGYTELLIMHKNKEDYDFHILNEIVKTSERAANLVQQLLLFSRKKELERKPVDLNHSIEQTDKILKRTIPKMIEINLRLDPQLWIIGADPVQLEQILLNLGKNAADAMPEGGELSIETENVQLDEGYMPNRWGTPPGRYVKLTVSDTGLGMDRETRNKIFEPFYTTKGIGKGTGLGLASVYGIVKNHGGYINCYSEIGRGSIFRIYFPVMEEGEDEPEKFRPVEAKPTPLGEETILLVDDEDAIRDFAKQALMYYGYKVMTASTGEEALEIYSGKINEIDLVILDLGMPGMGGHKCLQEMLQINHDVKVIITSGYSINGRAKKSMEAGAAKYVGKPYQLADLLKTAREVLDGIDRD